MALLFNKKKNSKHPTSKAVLKQANKPLHRSKSSLLNNIFPRKRLKKSRRANQAKPPNKSIEVRRSFYPTLGSLPTRKGQPIAGSSGIPRRLPWPRFGAIVQAQLQWILKGHFFSSSHSFLGSDGGWVGVQFFRGALNHACRVLWYCPKHVYLFVATLLWKATFNDCLFYSGNYYLWWDFEIWHWGMWA